MSAMESVYSVGPLPTLLSKLPYYAQLILGFGSIALLAWATCHVLFLGGAFCKKASTDIHSAFLTTAAPTIGLSQLMKLSKEQANINITTQGSIKDI